MIRFGAINERKVDALELLKLSLQNSEWEVPFAHPAGSAARGRSQALHFSPFCNVAIEEYDVWTRWEVK